MALHIQLGELKIELRFWFFVVVGLFAMLGKETLALYIALPILIHETGHLIALLFCRVKIQRIVLTSVSVDIIRSTVEIGLGKEICISLAGIAANLLAAGLLYQFAFQSMRIMFLIAANLAVALFNLLPIGDLDGGEVVRQICGYFLFPNAARNISRIVSLFALAPLFGLSIWLIVSRNGNFTLLLTCIYLAYAVIRRD